MTGIKQTFKYRDPRETKYLNRSQKDDLGRQRNHVLYGFDWKVNPGNRDQIILSKGAIYTQDGVKIFFDQETILPVIETGGNPDIRSDFPFPRNIIVGIKHNFEAATNSQDAQLVIIEVRTSKENQEPAYYIHEIDTIDLIPLDSELVDPDRPAYNGLYQNVPGGAPQPSLSKIAEQKKSYSIPENVTPIIKIRIQKIYNGGTVDIPVKLFTSSGQLSAGVDIVRYKNIWNQVNDMIGVNIFEPVIKKDLNDIFDLNYPSDSRTSQEFVKNSNSPIELPVTEQGTPTLHPLYGSFNPSEQHNFAAYRFASFLLDGRSLLEGMKRLDAWLRLLVNRTGEQTLINESLIELKDIVDKGLNGDPIIYGSPDFMLKSGNVFHKESSNVADTHKKAIHLLDNCVKYISNRLGLTPMMTRAEIDGTNPVVPELWDLSNPPGRDLTLNLNFHAAIKALRDNFTSRGNDTVTGTHFYSSDESDRDSIPVGQKTVINSITVIITNDIESNVNTKNSHTIKSNSAVITVKNVDESKVTTVKPDEIKLIQGSLESRLDKDVVIVSDSNAKSAAILHKEGSVELFVNNKSVETAAIENGASAKKVDYIQGLEVASLDHDSRYSVDKISSHDANKISLGQGPTIEGVINAPQSSSNTGALVNNFEINPRWTNEQLQEWAGTAGLSFHGNGYIDAIGGLNSDIGPFNTCRDQNLYLYYESNCSGMNGIVRFGIDFYDINFNAVSRQEFFNINTNTVSSNTLTILNPSNYPYYRYYIVNEGSSVVSFIIRVGSNFTKNNIITGTPNTDLDPDNTLVRKDYIVPKTIEYKTFLIEDEDTVHTDRPNGVSPVIYIGTEYICQTYAYTGVRVGQQLKVKDKDGNLWFIPGKKATGAYCACQCTCQCECTCTCECEGQCGGTSI